MQNCPAEVKEQVHHYRNNIRAQLKLLKVVEKALQLPLTPCSSTTEKSFRKEDAEEFLQHVLNEKCVIQDSFDHLFETMEKLGEGAQSVVKKVVEKSTEKPFAAKIIRNVDVEKIHNIKHQYKLLKTLDFPTIVKARYLFIDEDESVCRLVLEYCPWKNLKKELDDYGCFTEDLTAELIKTLLETVQYLHRIGVCHRDIKPQNILYSLGNSPPLKLIDFEISKLVSSSKFEMWTVTGSLFYKAPEMFSGSYTSKIDIWAIGVVAYELLHGNPPFVKEYVQQTINDICNTPIDGIIRQDISPFAQEFLKKCLSKNPKTRFSASDALKHPFILQANNTPVTPKCEKVNSLVGDNWQVTDYFADKAQEFVTEETKRENNWIKRSSLPMPGVVELQKKSSGFMDHELGIRVVTKSPNK